MASAGYPESSSHGDVIEGVAEADAVEGVQLLHAGTSRDTAGRLVTAGGRVLAVTACGRGVDEARGRAYRGVAYIHFDGSQHRTDIGRA
jgi:phosphoribosylamine--glycine ligase